MNEILQQARPCKTMLTRDIVDRLIRENRGCAVVRVPIVLSRDRDHTWLRRHQDRLELAPEIAAPVDGTADHLF